MSARRFSFEALVRLGLSYLPVAGGVTIVLIFGAFAELQTRALSYQAQRIEVSSELESMRADLEFEVGEQFEVLSRVSGAIAADPDMSAARFDSVVYSIVPSSTPIHGMAAVRDDAPLPFANGAFERAGPLANWLETAAVETPGARNIVDINGPGLLIWIPVYVGDALDTRRKWGHVAAFIDIESIFAAAGLRDQSRTLDIALTTNETGGNSRARALHLGHSSVLYRDPVTVDVAISGGDWALSALPKAGWSENSAAIWPIRVLTVLSLLLVAGPMIRTRALVDERQRYIVQLHKREEELAETSQRLGLALDASAIGVWEFNATANELYWDARMRELYGYPPEKEITYEDWRSRVHPDDVEQAESAGRKSLELGQNYETQFRIVLDDGSIRHIRAFATNSETDGIAKAVGANWDVTADVKRKEELEERQKEAEAASAAKSRFVATVSHEIRTPMNGVIGILELMLHDELSPEQLERANIVRNSAMHLLDIVNDLLDLSKINSEKIEIYPEPVNAGQMAQDIISLMSSIENEKNVNLISSHDGRLPKTIMCDPLRLRQVLMNLVGNAVKYTDKGQVHLAMGYDNEDGGILKVSVQDTGIGIAPEAIETLFERYSQVDSAEARKRGGTGLGLAICKELVNLMGGRISVESKPGEGSTFKFWIPAPAAEADAVAQPASATDDQAKRSTRVLVADDSAVNQKVLSGYLDMGGHDVTFVSNGLDAIANVQNGSFDLVLMDIEMPLMDGLTAAKRIRGLEGSASSIPIIALTANEEIAATSAHIDAGMDECIIKPVTVDGLFGAMDRLLHNERDINAGNAPTNHRLDLLGRSA